MDSRYSFSVAEETNIFTTTNETPVTPTTESVFSPLAAPFQSRLDKEYLRPHELRSSDTGSPSNDLDEAFLNIRLTRSDMLFDDTEHNAQNYLNGNLTDTAEPLQNNNVWAEDLNNVNARHSEMMDTYDFLIKSLTSASNYVSMLNREQLTVLRAIRPSLLYELLQEVAKVCSNKRTRRALPSECAFCKNNGENEECYSSHALKDWRGRVLCPVLRAFRCPRCGATGDRAHTIKYCPEPSHTGAERSGGFLSRRRAPSSPSLFSNNGGCFTGSNTTLPSSMSASSVNLSSSIWSSFNMN
ncbi:uncharacterized protein [Battus philenor]|uniref:uncharacterized protein n=1 Tax=Battus philenor TaxID=42288 RepID=UPI0035D01331